MAMPAACRPLHQLSLADLVGAMASRKVSQSCVLRYFLDRARQLNEGSNAVVELMKVPENLEALSSESASAGAGRTLEGVPILVKDSLDVDGFHTSCGTSLYAQRPPAQRDALIVARLRELGAVPIGKTNLPEFSLDVQSFNKLFGVTENPYSAGITAGGSSGGSAAAVALGMVPLAVGTDWAGSLRIPASFCGVCSMRASRGRMTINGSDAILPPMPTDSKETGEVYVAGVFTRTILDLQYAMAALLESPQPETSLSSPSGEEGIIGNSVTLGVTKQLPGVPTDNRILAALDGILDKLSSPSLGKLKEREGELQMGGGGRVGVRIIGKELEAPDWNWRDMDKALKVFSAGWNLKTETELESRKRRVEWALEVEARQRAAMEGFFASSGIGAWILPVCGVLPFEHNFEHKAFNVNGQEASYWRPLRGYVAPFSVSGHPVVTMPLTMVDGLPCGIQVVGRMGRDMDLLSICLQLESALGQLRPPESFLSFFPRAEKQMQAKL